MSSPSPFVGSLYGILEFVLYLRFWGLGGIFSLRNSRALVIASEAKQSLEILNSSLGNSRFILEILVFAVGNSRIPYYVILGLDPRISVMRSPDQVGG